ncbi:MAG TPA: hypothetical protein VG101_02660 [Puia sp.]|jgi:hypothetical protein|nr:hypothetical protein [Puia sp.]
MRSLLTAIGVALFFCLSVNASPCNTVIADTAIKPTAELLKTIHMDKTTTIIHPIYNAKDSTRSERIPILIVRDSAPTKNEDTLLISFVVTPLTIPFTPAILTANPIPIRKKDWKSNPKVTGDTNNVKMYDSIYLEIDNRGIDSLQQEAMGYISIPGGDNSFHAIHLTTKGLFPISPNIFVGSFIKSISGSKIPSNELLDIYLKINLVRRNQDNRVLWFSMMGADAGLWDSALVSLNEAMVNINGTLSRVTRDTKRVGFWGGGLKVFQSDAYIGMHLGLMEIDGLLEGSYIFAGYYYSPWLYGVKTPVDTAANRYRHNLYFEAAFSAFGNNAPKALQYIRIKFGLMLPMAVGYINGQGHAVGDNVTPSNKDYLYRLAVEVPLGGPIKF